MRLQRPKAVFVISADFDMANSTPFSVPKFTAVAVSHASDYQRKEDSQVSFY
jgi:hypothetical protein